MTIADWLIIAATLSGPVLAVQAQKAIERYAKSRSEKVAVFTSLMASRATRLSPEHIRALNLIDIVFIGNRKVIAAWREYNDSLNPPMRAESGELFINMLFEISNNLRFGFDKVMLRRVAYLPQAHIDAETAQLQIRESLLRMLTGQQEIQKGLLRYLSGEKALRITIDDKHT